MLQRRTTPSAAHTVVLEGNFNELELGGRQREALVALLAKLAREHGDSALLSRSVSVQYTDAGTKSSRISRISATRGEARRSIELRRSDGPRLTSRRAGLACRSPRQRLDGRLSRRAAGG